MPLLNRGPVQALPEMTPAIIFIQVDLYTLLALSHPLLPYTSERQCAWMSKITNDGLMRSATGCFIAVWQ